MILLHLLAITLAFVIDSLIGDPPHWPHPVRWIGSLIALLEKKLNKGERRKTKGLLMLLIVLFAASSVSFTLIYGSYLIHPLLGVVIEAVIISTTIAKKSLKEAALEVYEPLIHQRLPEARVKLSYIVGRDTDTLDEGEVTRGTVETVAENTSDGVTAPLFWALIGGGTAAMLYRAINTCDSMVGYRNDRYLHFGWASAKLDDLANYIPARLTSWLMLWTVAPVKRSRSDVWSIVRRDAKKHPSPNSGWCEAAVAGLLGIELGGRNTYKGQVSNRARMGDSLVPKQAEHILQTNTIMERASLNFLIVLWIGGILIEAAITWSQSSLFV